MKRIDLICLIASPIAVGLLMTYGGSRPMVVATLAILGWNLGAWVPETALLRAAQRWSPALRQAVTPAALALALLYLTVLSFGTLMTAYLKWRGMAEAELSVYRGFGALSGVLATLTFPTLQHTAGLVATGAGAIWLQLACLLVATAPAVASLLGLAVGSRAVLLCLVWGLVLSRFGLWTFDLAVNQLIQESVEHSQLGSINGVQGSLQSLCQMLAYAAGAVVWQPEKFAWLMAASCVVVATAAALYTAFAVLSQCGRRLAMIQPQLLPAEDPEGAGLLHGSNNMQEEL
ncbi:hypothetical protein N2152v2_007230 [Parachlorella kessleri]